MSKDTYTYKEILLGLRPQFLETKQLLDDLKGLTSSDKKKIRDYYFYLYQSLCEKSPNPELMVGFERKQSEFMAFIQRIKKMSGRGQPTASLMVKDNNDKYFPLNRRDCRVAVRYDKLAEFSTLAETILESDFAKNINFPSEYHPSYSSEKFVRVANYNTEFRKTENRQIQILTYRGREDIISYGAPRNIPLTNQALQELLNLEIPRDKIPPYHQNIIDACNDIDREIILGDDVSSYSYVKLGIEDTGKQLILTKTPRKKY